MRQNKISYVIFASRLIVLISILMLFIFAAIGWVKNILTLMKLTFEANAIEVICRIFGIFAVPVGSVMGWIS